MEAEIKKTIAKILDFLDLANSDVRLKSLIKNELWDLENRLKKLLAESKNGNTK
jgi:hypothetical protein